MEQGFAQQNPAAQQKTNLPNGTQGGSTEEADGTLAAFLKAVEDTYIAKLRVNLRKEWMRYLPEHVVLAEGGAYPAIYAAVTSAELIIAFSDPCDVEKRAALVARTCSHADTHARIVKELTALANETLPEVSPVYKLTGEPIPIDQIPRTEAGVIETVWMSEFTQQWIWRGVFRDRALARKEAARQALQALEAPRPVLTATDTTRLRWDAYIAEECRRWVESLRQDCQRLGIRFPEPMTPEERADIEAEINSWRNDPVLASGSPEPSATRASPRG